MEELNPTVKDFVDKIKLTVNNELNFIKNNDWTKTVSKGKESAPSRKRRESQHKVQALVTNRAVSNATKLYALCKEDTSHKSVKSVMDKLVKMFAIYDERYDIYTKEEDWTKYAEDGRDLEMEDEIEFQSDILKNVNAMKEALRKINFGGEGKHYEIEFRDNTPAPFAMEGVLEKLYPEIQKIKDARKSKPVSKAKRNTKKSS